MAESSKRSATKGEATPAVIKATKSLKELKREQEDDIKTKVNLKKPKKDVIIAHPGKEKSEMKEIMKGIADRLQRLEAKVDLLATKADLQAILIAVKGEKVPVMKPPAVSASDSEDSSYMDTSPDDKVTRTKAETSSSEDESSSSEEPANKPAASAKPAAFTIPPAAFTIPPAAKVYPYQQIVGGNGQTISVRGFDPSIPVDDIKSALSNYFSSFGEITRVFVPASRQTGASLGYAYIDLKQGAEKALKLRRHDVGGWNLVVGEAEPIRSGSSWPFPGRCGSIGRCTYC
ncbi:PREDICTED: nucleolin 1-like [Camelina sativa]|uniref:Nucleolin 1-like n=1 Tax=Camelina sativa TaxID=90675 RepID=A0ABM0TLL8_CAMSA|nr:PREDICTED: nucleolin 1-like [Camelina sativa]